MKLSQALSTQAPKLATNITEIDRLLEGGLPTGQIIEIYGCPGAGKTALAASLAAQVIKAGDEVVWLEASQTLPASRLLDFVASEDFSQETERRLLELVQVLRIPTLTSLIALLASMTEYKRSVITKSTKLLIVDDLTTLYNAAFPADSSRETNNKKSLVLTLLASRLSRLAVHYDIVILVLSKLTSKISKGGPAQLESPFGDAWTTACSIRLLLYRDTHTRRLPPGDELCLRWATVQRVKNKGILDPEAVPFKITGSSIESMNLGFDLSRSQSRLSQRSSVTLESAIDAGSIDKVNLADAQSAQEEYGDDDQDSFKASQDSVAVPSKRARYV